MILWLLSASCAFVLYATKDVLRSILGPWLSPSPLRNLKGPNNGTLILGHTRGFKAISVQPERWIMRVFEKFGPVTVIRGHFNSSILSTTDLKAASHIFNNTNIYHKSPQLSFEFATFVGEGIFTVEDEDHRRHRRTINPAFGPRSIRNMCDMFISKSTDLKEELGKLFDTQSSIGNSDTETKPGWIEADMMSWLSKITLDVVGLAGFDYSIDSLTGKDDGLYPALTEVFSDCNINPYLLLLKSWIPLFRLWKLDSTSRRIRRLHQMMRKLAKDVVARKANVVKDGSYETQSRDLLTLLIKANQEEGNASKRMSEEEVLGQVPSFLVGAHESVASAVVWTLFSLCNDPEIQTRLRMELQTLSNDNPTADELNSLTYLDHVVRESLRYHSIPAAYERVAIADDVIPCETPYEDRHGNVRTEIVIAKGDAVRVPILILNRLERLWGPDAGEFNPDRWENPPKAIEGIPAVWGNQATFVAGARSCPGYRFALLEMKALLFVLVKAFEFELAVPQENVCRRPLVAVLPIIKGEDICRLPMRLKRIS